MSIFSALSSVGKYVMPALSLATPLVGAYMQSSAAKSAAKTQAQAAAQAAELERQQYQQGRADLAPWMTSGRNALARLDQLLGVSPGGADNGALMRDFSMADFQRDPGYDFRMREGNRAIENSAAARGMQLSGATLKALQRYGQDMASQEYGAAYDRDLMNKNRKFNFLTGQSSPATATNVASMGANTSRSVADTYLQAGNARAAGQVGSSTAWGNALNDIGSYYRLRNLLKG